MSNFRILPAEYSVTSYALTCYVCIQQHLLLRDTRNL